MLTPGRPTILIVDDDEVIRILLRQFLEGEQYQVKEAKNGADALAELYANHYDLVILDISMPGLDGPGVCEQITSSLPSPPPVLMITALDEDDNVDRSFSSGAVDYIRKPIQWSVLRNRIQHILEADRTRRELEQLSGNYEMILDTAANGICGVDESQRISFINPAALKMLGYSKEEVLGRPFREIFRVSMPGTDEFDVNCCPFLDDSSKTASFQYDEIRLLRKDGTILPVDCRSTPILHKGKLEGGVLVFQDVTERQQAAEIIRFMANHDSLTNLPNRNFFTERLPQAISLAKRYNRLICLLFIDLDRFKPVNDTYGHAVGDKVLQEVADRLSKMLRSSDSVCRLGGDEFVILLESSASVEGAINVAEKTIEVLNEPIHVDDQTCSIGASVGISIYPNDCEDAESMLRHADIAMYEAKKKGRNCFVLYQPSGDVIQPAL